MKKQKPLKNSKKMKETSSDGPELFTVSKKQKQINFS
jgi:hypothetical protein